MAQSVVARCYCGLEEFGTGVHKFEPGSDRSSEKVFAEVSISHSRRMLGLCLELRTRSTSFPFPGMCHRCLKGINKFKENRTLLKKCTSVTHILDIYILVVVAFYFIHILSIQTLTQRFIKRSSSESTLTNMCRTYS